MFIVYDAVKFIGAHTNKAYYGSTISLFGIHGKAELINEVLFASYLFKLSASHQIADIE